MSAPEITFRVNRDRGAVWAYITLDSTVYVGGATCSPKDVFDLGLGMKIAFSRAVKEYTNIKKLRRDLWKIFTVTTGINPAEYFKPRKPAVKPYIVSKTITRMIHATGPSDAYRRAKEERGRLIGKPHYCATAYSTVTI